MFSSNQEFVITGDKKGNLLEVLKLVDTLYGIRKPGENYGHTVQGFIYNEDSFEMLWSAKDIKGVSSIPKNTVESMHNMVLSFLENTANYDKASGENSGDGGCKKGWKVTRGGRMNDNYQFYVIVKVEPFWTYYSK